MKLSEELEVRGFIHQYSAPTLAEILDGPKRTIYHGIDPTADSAHAGNFVNWMLLRHLAQAGHRIVFLVGGGTGMIGDPKPDVERTLTDPSLIAERVEKLKTQAERLLGNDHIEFVNNYDWLRELDLIGFLRTIGKHFTVNELLKKDAIATRLGSETGLSYTEFAYPLLQAYDYLTLHKTKGCDLQVGGSDQWGNMIAGVDLIRRLEQKTVHVLTVPLVVDKTTGKKFGKSEGNAVWLDAELTTPYHFYQFWFNTADENVITYLKLFTLIPLTVIDGIERDLLQNPGARQAQRVLADEITAFVHGNDTAQRVRRVSECLFGEVHISDLSAEEQVLLRENAPMVVSQNSSLLMDVLVESGLASSKREARTFVESGAVWVQGKKIEDPNFVLRYDEVGTLIHLQRGKKQVVVVELV
jgi:tyrosyl-tRNA synthetase